MFTVHTTAVDPRSAAKNAAPLAIGLSVFLAHVLLVPVTGCGINPARTFGPSFVGWVVSGDIPVSVAAPEDGTPYMGIVPFWPGARQAWIFYIGPLLGGLFGAVVCGAGLDTDKENWTAQGNPKPAAADNAKLRLPRTTTEPTHGGETELAAV